MACTAISACPLEAAGSVPASTTNHCKSLHMIIRRTRTDARGPERRREFHWAWRNSHSARAPLVSEWPAIAETPAAEAATARLARNRSALLAHRLCAALQGVGKRAQSIAHL